MSQRRLSRARDEKLRRFAVSAVAFWAFTMQVKVKRTTTFWSDWQSKHGPYKAMYQTAEEKAARCVTRYRRPPGPMPIGYACQGCRMVLIAVNENQRSLREVWNTAAHEVIHLKYPRWSEAQIERATDLVCELWPWQTLLKRFWKSRKGAA